MVGIFAITSLNFLFKNFSDHQKKKAKTKINSWWLEMIKYSTVIPLCDLINVLFLMPYIYLDSRLWNLWNFIKNISIEIKFTKFKFGIHSSSGSGERCFWHLCLCFFANQEQWQKQFKHECELWKMFCV